MAYEQAITQTEGLAGGAERAANAWAELNLSIGEGNGLIDQTIGLWADFLLLLGKIPEALKEVEVSASAKVAGDLAFIEAINRSRGKGGTFNERFRDAQEIRLQAQAKFQEGIPETIPEPTPQPPPKPTIISTAATEEQAKRAAENFDEFFAAFNINC